jgi:hypothetical protein
MLHLTIGMLVTSLHRMSEPTQGTPTPELQINPPKGGKLGTMASAYGLLLGIPAVLAMLIVSAMPFGPLTFVFPIVAIALTAFFAPFGFGNPYVKRMARSLCPPSEEHKQGFCVQITFEPRLRSGMRALFEDADDIGWLTVIGPNLAFFGDSIQLVLPLSQIRSVQAQNIGWRGLFLCGPRTVLSLTGLPNVKSVQFAERSSSILPESRSNAAKLWKFLTEQQRAKELPKDKP